MSETVTAGTRTDNSPKLGGATRYAARSLSLVSLMVLAGFLGISLVVFAHSRLRTLTDASELHFAAWEGAINTCKFLADQNPSGTLPPHVVRDIVDMLLSDEKRIQNTKDEVDRSLQGIGIKLAFLFATSESQAHEIRTSDIAADIKDHLHNLTTVPLEILPAVVSGLNLITSIKIQSRKALDPLSSRRVELQRALSKSISVVWVMTTVMSGAVLLGILLAWVSLLKPPLNQLDEAVIQVWRSQQELQTTLDSISDAVIATNSDLDVINMNPSAQALTGWPIADARGMPLRKVMRLEVQRAEVGAPESVDVRRLAAPGYLPSDVYTLISRNGEKFRVRESVAPLRLANHDLYGIVIVLRDVSLQLELQKEVDRKVKLQVIGELAAGVAHDFNNHLGTIMGISSLAIHQEGTKQNKDRFEAILRASRAGASLTENLLSFARSSPPNPKVQSIQGILEDAATRAKSTLGKSFQTSIICNPDLQAEVDRDHLVTALIHLIGSSIEQPSDDRQLLILAYEEVRNSVNCLTICVEGGGNGGGKQAPPLVDSFFPKTSSPKSRGIGLPMAAAFAEQAGGELRVVSGGSPAGTSVFMHFPMPPRLIAA